MTPAVPAVPARRGRRGIRVRGVVQGIGMRPAVYRLATELCLGGFVRNDPQGVWIEIEGEVAALARFVEQLPGQVPALGHVERVDVVELAIAGEPGAAFRVEASARRGSVEAAVPADAATCDACLAELFCPRDRRHRYPFINCTQCGPRYTIVRDVPYDRARTTMDAFALCAPCRAEYDDPGDRRFHAEPNACPDCGPRLTWWPDPAVAGEAALAAAVAALRGGGIVAVKGLGGFHLAVDATDDEAVARLRARKHRPHRPLAVMARSLDQAGRIASIDPIAREALVSAARPIVLLRARPGAEVAAGVAPGLTELGVMLPYTPIHHLLLADGPPLLVMTSGNRVDEPIARTDDEARDKLAGIADGFLLHDRAIHTRADDSVVRPVAGAIQAIRRSRGVVPESIALAVSAPPICAVGAEVKNTVCLTRGDRAFLSPHVGDLASAETYAFFTEMIEKLSGLLGAAPEIVAHDLHPDYLSTRWALESALPREPVQHHHAHVASCLADNEREGPVLGVAFDGTGCGPAGDLWGGEILLADMTSFARVAHLSPVALPGGEAAIREPWRLAAAALIDAGLPLDRLARIPRDRLQAIARLCQRAPRATGAGRWFDAVSALCGIRDAVSYEGQAAVELEAIAAPGSARPYPVALLEEAGPANPRGGPAGRAFGSTLGGTCGVFDMRPVVRDVVADLDGAVDAAVVAARFHRTLAEIVLAAARRFGPRLGTHSVALSGGCFQNALLTETTIDLLAAEGFDVLVHRRVPPSDGGIALGQAAVAAHRWHHRHNGRSNVSGHTG
jgi:hydrogenase maturation protein HypF